MGQPGNGVTKILSVNKAGSVPPVEADLTTGAAVTCNSSTLILDCLCDLFWQGITFTSASGQAIQFNNAAIRYHYFLNCAFVLAGSGSANIGTNNPTNVTWDNTTVTFNATGQGIAAFNYGFLLNWINTPSALGGSTFPTTLFKSPGTAPSVINCRGVDLSALTGTLVAPGAVNSGQQKILLDSCKIASGVTRYGTPSNATEAGDEVELVNCYDGTKILSERYTNVGTLTTDTSTSTVSLTLSAPRKPAYGLIPKSVCRIVVVAW